VLVVDDQRIFRVTARKLLELSGDVAVVAEAASVTEALSALDATDVDLVLMDVNMPEVDGVYGAHLIASLPRPPLVVLCSAKRLRELPTIPDGLAVAFLPKEDLDARRLLDVWDARAGG
jgi:DNA-binding NarL/FixJ family response regulator